MNNRLIIYFKNKLRILKWKILGINDNTSNETIREIDLLLIDKLLKKNNTLHPTVIDIGANVGLYSKVILEALFERKGKCISFEPRNDVYKALKKRVNSDYMVAENFSISNHINTSKLFLSASHGKNSLFKYDEFIGFDWQYTNSITLDSYISTNSIKNIELIKIDVEGHEFQVIEGSLGTLAKFRPIVLCEVENRHLLPQGKNVNEFLEMMLSLDYKSYILDKNSQKLISTNLIEIPLSKTDNKIYYYNYWFIPQENEDIIKNFSSQ